MKALHELRVRVGLAKGVSSDDPWSAANTQGARTPSNLPANTDREELVSSTLFQVVGLYGILMSSLLTVFIQQNCSETTCVGTGAATVCTTVKQACSFGENLGVKAQFGKLVVAFNFVTLAVFLVSNALFFYRGACVRVSCAMQRAALIVC